MLSRTGRLRSRAIVTLMALTAPLLAVAVVPASAAQPDDTTQVAAKAAQDPRKTRGLFVDPKMPAAKQEAVYRTSIGKSAQALWIVPEAYPTSKVRGVIRAYTSRALKARKTPTLSIYGIPGRDCGSQSSGGLKTAAQYRAWIRQVARGVRDQRTILVLEPDALPLFSSDSTTCATKPDGWKGMLRFASKTLSNAGAWVYLDAGHSNWTPYDERPSILKQAGIEFARGFSTNVSNFRPTADEKAYADTLLDGLRALDVKGKHYVIDTSRNGAVPSADGSDVLNPRWARLGKPPRLVFDGPYDGALWVKHPGESDGKVNGGPQSGKWCDFLADRLLDRSESDTC